MLQLMRPMNNTQLLLLVCKGMPMQQQAGADASESSVVPAWWVRSAVGLVLALAVADWAGWALGVESLTRGYSAWPQMTPWTALLLAGLGASILLQAGQPSPARVWLGTALAVLTGVLAVAFVAEYLGGGSFGLDDMWFSNQIHQLQQSWPGRPSPQTAVSVLVLSAALAVMPAGGRWACRVWGAGAG